MQSKPFTTANLDGIKRFKEAGDRPINDLKVSHENFASTIQVIASVIANDTYGKFTDILTQVSDS